MRGCASSASTCCCSRPAPTCRTSPGTRRCRSSGSRCSCSRPTATRCSWCHGSRRRASSSSPTRSSIRPWDETDDPIDVVAGLRASARRARAIGDHTWARFVLDLQDALPARRVPARDRRHRAAARRQGRGRGRRAARPRRTPSTTIAGDDARPAVRRAHASSTCTASSSSACSTPGTSAPTSPSSPPGPNAASPHHDPSRARDRAPATSCCATSAARCTATAPTSRGCSSSASPSAEVRDAYAVLVEAQEAGVRAATVGTRVRSRRRRRRAT